MVFFGDQKIEILQVNQDRLHNSFNFISGSSSQAKVRVTFFWRFFFGMMIPTKLKPPATVTDSRGRWSDLSAGH